MKARLISSLTIFLMWHFISKLYNPIILPSPFEVGKSMFHIFKSYELYSSVFYSSAKLAVGLFFTVVIGFFLGWIMAINKFIKNILHPIVVFMQSVPVISWILLALIWFVPSIIPIFILVINGVSIISFSVYEGIKGIDSKLLEMASLYKVGKKKLLFDLYIPCVTDNFIGSLKAVLASAYKVVVMAEVISRTDKGIGSKINWAWINIETSEILAWSLVVVLLSHLLEKVVISNTEKLLERCYA